MNRLTEVLNRSLREVGVELFRLEPDTAGYGLTSTRTLRNTVLQTLARAGYGARRTYGGDVPSWIAEVGDRVFPYTMTSRQSVVGLCEAVEYIVRAEIPGALVECGVWRGGSVMAIALTLQRLGVCDRELYLFDTFAGMTQAGEYDVSLIDPGHHTPEHWGHVEAEVVRANVTSTGYPSELVRLVEGPVESTVPACAPASIALLRLDTDWYSSTRHELEHLYPRLSPRGVLILDDYGTWAGARRAVDEYEPARELALIRLDNTCRIAVRP